MNKFGRFGDYPTGSLALAESALLTAWRSLERYQGDIVLVGGLAIHYLTRRDLVGLPGAVTMDVDFGITLGACGGQYGTIKSDLGGLGFASQDSRLVRKFEDTNLYIDFLTEHPPDVSGSCIVDDITATIAPGIKRALACPRIVKLKGTDLYGAKQCCHVAVSDIGPMLVLKLNAFGGPTGRRHPKDAYDILLAVTGFIEVPEAAIQSFQAESRAQNQGFPSALAALKKDFLDPNHDGPRRAAEFHPGSPEDRERVRQDAATVGKLLVEAVS